MQVSFKIVCCYYITIIIVLGVFSAHMWHLQAIPPKVRILEIYSLEIELQVIVSYHVGAGAQIPISCESSQCF